MGKIPDLQDALDKLAERFEGGHLSVQTNPVGFIEEVIEEIDRLRIKGEDKVNHVSKGEAKAGGE